MPPILIVIGGVVFLNWLFFDDDKETPPPAAPVIDAGNFVPPAEEIPVSGFVTLEILREIFENGARPLRRRDVVAILKAAPYCVPKTNAYRALAPSSLFAPWLREEKNGWLRFEP
jgi:hypothetical protein